MVKVSKEKKHSKTFGNKEVVFLVIVTCIISLIVGYSLNNKKSNNIEDKTLKEFISTYDEITNKYYKDVDKNELLSGAVNGMLSALDKHSTVVDRDTNENFYLTLEGSYNGIGIEVINENNNIVVIGVIENSPAEKIGIKEGDIIKKVDDIDFINKETSELTNYIRKNNNKSKFKLIIDRNGEELTYELEKQNVIIKSVLSKIIERENKKIGYIYISIFSNTTASQFIKQLDELEKQGIDSLIIDVRENSGGHLSTVISMLSNMLDSDKVMYQIEKDSKITKYHSMGDKNKKYPIVVLQNSNSASASELFAISLRENLNATIVGETSYGKGTIQEYNYLSNGDMYKYTTKKWLSPKGNFINDIGVKPDIEVFLDEIYENDPSDDNDKQLQTAINTIINK